MVRKLGAIANLAKLCGRNFSSSATIVQKRSTETSMGLTWRMLGFAGGYRIGSVTYYSKSQFVLEEEQRTLANTEKLKSILRRLDMKDAGPVGEENL